MKLTLLIVGILCCGLPASSTSAQSPTQGHYSGSVHYELSTLRIHQFEGRATYTLMEFRGTSQSASGSGIFHQTRFECTYSVEIRGQKTEGTGHCTFVDREGNQVLTRLHTEGTAGQYGLQGTMDILAGTGKYAGIKGGGWVHALSVPAGTRPDGPGEALFGGSYIIP